MCLGMYINYRVPNPAQRLGPEKKLVANKPNTQTWAKPTIFLAGSTGFERMRDIVGLSKAQRISGASRTSAQARCKIHKIVRIKLEHVPNPARRKEENFSLNEPKPGTTLALILAKPTSSMALQGSKESRIR